VEAELEPLCRHAMGGASIVLTLVRVPQTEPHHLSLIAATQWHDLGQEDEVLRGIGHFHTKSRGGIRSLSVGV
jgi:hypothetical protein